MPELPSFVNDFFNTFKAHNFEIFLVGGAVRHLLMGEEIKNWDFTTNARPEEIQKLFPHSFYNNKFGTVGIPQDVNGEEVVLEVTTYRKESDYSDKRRPDIIEWTDKLEEDLQRRDFTINAMAYDGKKLVDPFNGQDDLKNKLIKAVGNPDKRFSEDALRLMRGIRLTAQMGLMIEENTRESIKRNAHLIQHISWERIRDEFFKILNSSHPAEGVLFLRNSELLRYILPELDMCFSIPQKSPERHHIYDVGTHLVMSLKNCPSRDTITRFATLIHDVGKAKTFRKDDETQIITFYNHEVVGGKQTEEIADRFKLSNEEKKKLVTLVRYHQFTVSELQTDKAVRRFIREIGKEYIDDMLALRTADRIGSGARPTSWRYELFKKRLVEVQKEPFKVTDLKIDGNDVMRVLNLKPGPKIGKILQDLFDEVIEQKITNERTVLLSRLNKLNPQT